MRIFCQMYGYLSQIAHKPGDQRDVTITNQSDFNHQEAIDSTLTSALDFSIPFEAGLTFANEMRRQVATLCVLDTPGAEGGVLTLVDICAFVSISSVTFTA